MNEHTLSVLLGLVVLVAVLAGAGCVVNNTGHDTFTATDDLGTKISLNDPAARIIPLAPSVTEMVFALGAGERVVAVDSASNYPPAVSSLEKVSDWSGMNTERMVTLAPDLIVMDHTLDMDGNDHDSLVSLGFTVYQVYPHGLDDITDTMSRLAVLLGENDAATTFVGDWNTRVETVRSAAANDTGTAPTILHVNYYDGTSDPWVGTDTTFTGNLITTAGGEPAVSDSTGLFIQVSLETIIATDPDIIICSQSATWPVPSRDALLSDDTLANVTAIHDGRVYEVDGDLIDRAGPRMIDGLEEVRTRVADPSP